MKRKTVLDVLTEARGRISRGWTKGTSARDRNGRSVMPSSPHAVRYCASGAVLASAYPGSYSVGAMNLRRDTKSALVGALPKQFTRAHQLGGIISYNDHPGTRKRQVIGLFNRAIRNVRKQTP